MKSKMTDEFKRNYIKAHGKKAFEELCKKQRTVNGFNTGTRKHKSIKDYHRQPKHKGKSYDEY